MRYSVDATSNNETKGLLGLPLVIIRTIFEEVHHDDSEAFKTLSLVSKDSRRECERLLFRTLSINDKTVRATKGDLHIFTRLTDPEDLVSEHVKHVWIGPFTDLGYYSQAIAPAVEPALPYLTNLQSLHWNSPLPLLPNVLDNLYELCPSAKLHVTNRDRRLLQLSQPLLSYPRLHTLDIMLYYMNLGKGGMRDYSEVFSEFDILKNCLIQGASVRVLRIEAKSGLEGRVVRGPNGFEPAPEPGYALKEWEGLTTGRLCFHWEEGDLFPPLEELKLYHHGYDMSPEQCSMWTRCMDWSRLRKLDVDQGAPRYLFEALVGRVPQLKSLTLGVWEDYGHRLPNWELHDIPTMSNLLASITALEEMKIFVFDYNRFMTILPAIFEKVGRTLKVLDAKCVGYFSKRWTENDFMAVLDSCPALTSLRLELRFHTVEGHWLDKHVPAQEKYESLIFNKSQVPTEWQGDFRGM